MECDQGKRQQASKSSSASWTELHALCLCACGAPPSDVLDVLEAAAASGKLVGDLGHAVRAETFGADVGVPFKEMCAANQQLRDRFQDFVTATKGNARRALRKGRLRLAVGAVVVVFACFATALVVLCDLLSIEGHSHDDDIGMCPAIRLR